MHAPRTTSGSAGGSGWLPAARRNLALLVFGAALFATSFGLILYLLGTGYHEVRRAAVTTSSNLASTLQLSLDSTLRRVSFALDEMRASIPPEEMTQDAVAANGPRIKAALGRLLDGFPDVSGLRVFDAAGNLLYDSGTAGATTNNVADRQHFLEAKANPKAGTIYSNALVGRVTGKDIIVAAQGIWDPQGKFLGEILATLDLDYFRTLFKSLDVGPGGLVAVTRSDDFQLVMRWPEMPAQINKVVPSSNPVRSAIEKGAKAKTITARSFTDNLVRIFSVRTLNDYPFYVVVALARSDVLAPWYRLVAITFGAGLLVLLLIAGLAARVRHSLLRERAIVSQLAASEQKSRLMASGFELSAASIVLFVGEHGQIAAANPTFLKTNGYERAEVIGQLSSLIDGHSMTAEQRQACDAVLDCIGRWEGELPGRRKDGTRYPRWVSLARVRDEVDGTVYTVSSSVDITELKRVEQELREYAEAAAPL